MYFKMDRGCAAVNPAIPETRRVEQRERHGGGEGGTQAVNASQAKAGRSYRQCQAMHEVEEHSGLPEHVEHAVLADANTKLDRP
jgi:hypothetical protein